MVRVIFWVMLLANLVFLVLMQWGGALTRDESSLQIQPALNPEKIRLAPASAVAQSSVVTAVSAPLPVQPVPVSAVQPATQQAMPLTQTQPSPSSGAACLEWGEFSGSDLAHANERLKTLNLGDKLTQRHVEHSTGYWVYIPPLKSHAELNKKISQLKKLGVKQYFVVQEKGKWHNAISLGVFKSAELAKKFLGALKAQGVRSAVDGERQAKLKFSIFLLKMPDAGTLSKLVEWQKDFTGIEMKAVPCN